MVLGVVFLIGTFFHIDQRENVEHWQLTAQDLFSEWIYDACGSHDNANIHWDDMYFDCKVPLTQEARESQLEMREGRGNGALLEFIKDVADEDCSPYGEPEIFEDLSWECHAI